VKHPPSSLRRRLLAALLLPLVLGAGEVHGHGAATRPWTLADLALIRQLRAPREPTPLPAGSTLLQFGEFFERPSGPRGLAPTARLRALAGQRVRLFGYMVQQDLPLPGRFLLAQRPVILAERADGVADDLPPEVVYVQFPALSARRVVPYAPGVLMLEGRLQVGAIDEPDGRVSYVRLELELPEEKR
jgi:hypothetical protein